MPFLTFFREFLNKNLNFGLGATGNCQKDKLTHTREGKLTYNSLKVKYIKCLGSLSWTK